MKKYLAPALLAAGLAMSSLTHAAIQSHSFTLTGSSGETGSGTFTWDDTVSPNGSFIRLGTGTMLTLSFTVTGANVVGGTVTFTEADCTDSVGSLTPDFTSDINFFTCSAGGNTLDGIFPNTASFSGVGSSTITFTSGTTTPVAAPAPTSIPTMPFYGFVLTALGLGWVARRRLAKKA